MREVRRRHVPKHLVALLLLSAWYRSSETH
jgi:hypothetical protein